MSLRIFAGAATIVVTAWVSAAPLHAQSGVALLANANYTRPVRWTFGGTMVLSLNFDKQENKGIVVGGSVGVNGMKVSGGLAGLSTDGDKDVRAVVTRTWTDPRGASANSTYLGGEVGFGLLWRVSVGYAKRVVGPSTADDHIVTWGLGVDVPAWFHQRARGTGGTHTASSAREGLPWHPPAD